MCNFIWEQELSGMTCSEWMKSWRKYLSLIMLLRSSVKVISSTLILTYRCCFSSQHSLFLFTIQSQ